MAIAVLQVPQGSWLHTIQSDPAIFICKSNRIPLIVLVHVDDIAVVGPSRELINPFKGQLAQEYEIEENSLINSFLGFKIIRDRTAKRLTLSQKTCIESLAKEFLGKTVNSKPIPLEPNQHFEPNLEPVDENLQTEYQRLIGSLMWVAVRTRVDIAYTISVIPRFLQNPSKKY
jgi:hypothetical protein